MRCVALVLLAGCQPEPRAIRYGEDACAHCKMTVSDDRFVINYFRLSPDNRLLFGGGETYGYRFPADIRSTVRKPMLEVMFGSEETAGNALHTHIMHRQA